MYRVGIIGTGNIGYFYEHDKHRIHPCTHFGAYCAYPDTVVVAVSDVDEEKLKQFQSENKEVHVYSDYEEMLNKEKLEIISICTSLETHCRILRNVVRFNSVRLVFCEKPLASTVYECRQMINDTKEFGVALAVNFTRRWDSTYIMVKNIIDSKSFGDIIKIVGYASREKDFEGNIHMLDLLNWFCELNPNPDTFVHHSYFKTFEYIDCYPTNYLIFELDLISSNGRITVKNNGRDIAFYMPEKSSYYEGINELIENTTCKSAVKPTPIQNAVTNIVNFLNGKEELRCVGEDGLKALELWNMLRR